MIRRILPLIVGAALAGGCSKPPTFPPEMTCDALEAELEDAERTLRTLEGDATELDARDLMGDVHARSNQGDDEWRRAKRISEAQEHLEAVKAAIGDRCTATEEAGAPDGRRR